MLKYTMTALLSSVMLFAAKIEDLSAKSIKESSVESIISNKIDVSTNAESVKKENFLYRLSPSSRSPWTPE